MQSFSLLVILSLFLFSAVGNKYYGRAFGTVYNWERIDKKTSHHLEIYFDPMPEYENFTANMNIESRDGSSLSVAALKGSDLIDLLPLVQQSNTSGVRSLSSGLSYCKMLSKSQFRSMNEDAYTKLIVTMLQNSAYAYFFGQVYHDNDGTSGIHDIHRIPNYPGDGGLITVDRYGNYFGVFGYFNDQSLC